MNAISRAIPATFALVSLLLPAAASATVPAAPKIIITNTDGRRIENLRISVCFYIDGKRHCDYEDHRAFDAVVLDGLSGWNGTWNGTMFVGNFLYQEARKSTTQVLKAINKLLAQSGDNWSDAGDGPILPSITIAKKDGRAITGMRITADFTINGQRYSDYEDVGNFDHLYGMELNGMNGTWNGSIWVGNFLRTTYAGYETQIDPNLLTFLNVLMAVFQVAGSVLPDHGHQWKFRQLM